MLIFLYFPMILIFKVIFLIVRNDYKNKIWINNLYGTLLWLIFF